MGIEAILNNALSAKPQYKYVSEYNPKNSNIRALTLEGESFSGQKTKVFGYYGLPEKAPDKVPAVVLIHGGGGHAYHCWVKQWNDRGYAAIAIDTTGFMPKTVNAGYKEGDGDNWERELNGVFAEEGYVCTPDNDRMKIAGKNIEEHWMLHAVSAAIRANSFLREQPQIYSEKIGVVGISWGGVITSILIGYDKRFSFAIPIYGSGYLGDSLADLMKVFKDPEVRQNWIAENRFDKVKIPVLWLAWNDDCAFSVQSNTKSYLHSRINNGNCRLSIVNLMKHSHIDAWQREEPFYFADWLAKNKAMMPYIADKSLGEKILLSINADKDTVVISATLYYISEPMHYEVTSKHGLEDKSFMAGEWKTVPLKLKNNMAEGIMPQDAVGYYCEVIFACNGKEMNVTTGYKEN